MALQHSFRDETFEELLQFFWRQWGQLGVAASVSHRDSWVIDPEALLLATLTAGRFDPRLFDEVIDWCLQNGRWISLQRLKNITRSSGIVAGSILSRTLTGVAAFIDAQDTKIRWRTLDTAKEPDSKSQSEPLFLRFDGTPLPLWFARDDTFGKSGIDRPTVQFRGLSSKISTDQPAALIFKLRTLFGLSPKAEVIAYLYTHAYGKIGEIAALAHYSRPATRDALNEMAMGGFVVGPTRGTYEIDQNRWRGFLNRPGPLPVWLDWIKIFDAIRLVIGELTDCDKTSASDYMKASRMLRVYDHLKRSLSLSGLPNPFQAPVDIGNVSTWLPIRIKEFADTLATGTFIDEPHCSS